MSYLEQLLEGIDFEWKPLGDLVELANIGVDKKINAGEQKVRLLNFVDVFKNQYISNDTPSMIVTASARKIIDCSIKEGDVFITPSSELIDEIGFAAMAIEDFDNAVYSYHIMRLRINDRNTLLPAYLNFLFSSSDVRKQIQKKSQGITRYGLTQPIWKSIIIPIPSLEIQQQIVAILDTLTEVTAELTAELTSELTARKQQYNHYRDELLTFDDDSVEWKSLGEVGAIRMCKRILKEQTTDVGDIPFYKIGTFGKEPNAYISQKIFNEYRSKYNYPKIGEVLISASGTIGRTVIFDGIDSYFQDSNIVWIENDESQVLNKYLFYFYQIAKWEIADGGTIQRLYNDNLKKTKIQIPSLKEQYRIVSILDRFDILTTSISEGLVKEIEQRKQQYDYYRDLLLTFNNENLEE